MVVFSFLFKIPIPIQIPIQQKKEEDIYIGDSLFIFIKGSNPEKTNWYK